MAAALQHADDIEQHLRELALMREGPARLAKRRAFEPTEKGCPFRSRELEHCSTDGLEFALRRAHQLLATIYI